MRVGGLTKLQWQELRSHPLWGQVKTKELRSPSEHVQTAERLAKEHNGILPWPGWVRAHFRALFNCMRNYPELFSHIQQAKNPSSMKPFAEARDLARTQGFNSRTEYARWAKNIAGMPVTPHRVYKDKGWAGWGDFIGTEIRPQWPPFAETKAVIRAHGIKTCTQFKAWGQERRANKIPSNPHVIYKNAGWAGWGDFFSTEKRPRSHWLSFAEAKAGVRAHGIKTQAQFRAWPKRFANKIPLKPERVYKNAGWISWYDFLDKEPPKFKTYADCHPDRKHFARGLCAKCYERKRERKRPLVAPERPLAVFEREAELVEA